MKPEDDTDNLEQTSLLDLSGKEFNVMWVDESAPLFIANNPLHWKAHKLQVFIARLEKHAEKNPAQFNSKNYMDVLDKFEKIMEEIGNANKVLDAPTVGGQSTGSINSPTMGAGNAPGMDSGISADNPLAGQRSNPV